MNFLMKQLRFICERIERRAQRRKPLKPLPLHLMGQRQVFVFSKMAWRLTILCPDHFVVPSTPQQGQEKIISIFLNNRKQFDIELKLLTKLRIM